MSFKCRYLFILEKCCCCVNLKKGNIALGLTVIGAYSIYFIFLMGMSYELINEASSYWHELLTTYRGHMYWLFFWVGYHTLAVCMAIVHVSGSIQPKSQLLMISLYWNCFNIFFISIISMLVLALRMGLVILVFIYYAILNFSLLNEVNNELNAYLTDDNEWSYELHPFYN